MFAVPSGSSSAKALWKMRDAEERGDTYHDQSYAIKIERGEGFRRELSNVHRKEPVSCFVGCGKWKREKTRTRRLEGAEVYFPVSFFLRGERKVGTSRCVHVFLCGERCLPLGGASRFELDIHVVNVAVCDGPALEHGRVALRRNRDRKQLGQTTGEKCPRNGGLCSGKGALT